MHMNDIKLFAKNEKGLEILIQAIRIYSQGIGIEFGVENWAVRIMRNRKQDIMEDIELPNQQKLECLEKKKLTNTWEYWKRTPSNR